MDGWMDGEAAGQMSLFIRIAGINYSRGFEGAAQERGGGVGSIYRKEKQKKTDKWTWGEKRIPTVITVSQSRMKRPAAADGLAWRCGIKGIEVRFKGEHARAPSRSLKFLRPSEAPACSVGRVKVVQCVITL